MSAARHATWFALLAMAAAQAHDTRPLSVSIVEQTPALYRVVVRAPPTIEAANVPRIVWPSNCVVRDSAPLRLEPGAASVVVCRGGLEGQELRIEYGLYNPSITTLIRLEALGGLARTAVLAPDALVWSVPETPDWRSVALDYAVLGFEHIWRGLDHLLFVAGLMLLARSPRRILIAVTGFTVAHSITLSLAALGIVRVPVELVEAMIALSILFLAGELSRRDASGFSHRYPVVLAFVFGLLHGFGFASALGDVGLPPTDVAIGLLFFNIGVEFGQLTFMAAAAGLVLAWRRWITHLRGQPRATWPAAPYALGIPAAFWFFERAVTAFTQ
jgi:hydrogenase/urease accessory protein HupE